MFGCCGCGSLGNAVAHEAEADAANFVEVGNGCGGDGSERGGVGGGDGFGDCFGGDDGS